MIATDRRITFPVYLSGTRRNAETGVEIHSGSNMIEGRYYSVWVPTRTGRDRIVKVATFAEARYEAEQAVRAARTEIATAYDQATRPADAPIVAYTTQGAMTAADLAEYKADHDLGATTHPGDDLPEWMDEHADCPLCGQKLLDHDHVTVGRASGEIEACEIDGDRSERSDFAEDRWGTGGSEFYA